MTNSDASLVGSTDNTTWFTLKQEGDFLATFTFEVQFVCFVTAVSFDTPFLGTDGVEIIYDVRSQSDVVTAPYTII